MDNYYISNTLERRKQKPKMNKSVKKSLLSICEVSLTLGLEKMLKAQFLPCVSLPCWGAGVSVAWALTEELRKTEFRIKASEVTVTTNIPKQS